MKNLQSFLITASIIIGIFAATLLMSCNGDKCKRIKCENGGVCKEVDQTYGGKIGECECAAGFEGEAPYAFQNCKIESRVKLLGNYSLSGYDNIGGTYANINTSIAASPLSKTKIILDVNGMFNLTCSMSSSFQFNVDPATIAGYTYNGNGFHNWNDTIALSVTKTNGIDSIVYTLSGPK